VDGAFAAMLILGLPQHSSAFFRSLGLSERLVIEIRT
jgi:hypothetical protein